MIQKPRFSLLIFLLFILLNSPELYSQELPQSGIVETDTVTLSSDEIMQLKEKIQNEYIAKAELIIHHYVSAQQLLFKERHTEALDQINKALKTHENADLLGLKGIILFKMEKYQEAERVFIKAFSKDKDLTLIPIKGLKEWLQAKNIID